VRPRRLGGASGRPLNFTVRSCVSAVNLLLLVFFSPVLVTALAVAMAISAYQSGTPVQQLWALAGRMMLFAFIGAALSLVATLACMIWYEHTTGYSAGDAPLGWLFFYGPISISLGELGAMVTWWRTMRRAQAAGPNNRWRGP